MSKDASGRNGSTATVDVFLSYARKDRDCAATMTRALSAEGFSVWWDVEIGLSEDFRTALESKLDATRSVVVLWSAASVKSNWVIAEAEDARSRGKLLQVCIEDDIRLPLDFRGLQYASLGAFTGDRTNPEFRRLCHAIRQMQGRRPTGEVDAHVPVPTALADERAKSKVAPRTTKWLAGVLALGALLLLAALMIPERGQTKTAIDGLVYRRIPAGDFEMGCDRCEPDESPARRITLTQDFWLTETEVTVAAYRRFAQATSRSMPPQTGSPDVDPARFNPGWSTEDHPMVNVSHDEAVAYCKWAGGSSPWNQGDLPTEAQWEYAARGGTSGSSFPWGDAISRDKANYGYKDPATGRIYPRASERGARDRWLFTSPVKSFDPNGFGLYDMVGNVQEWCRDAFRSYDKQQLLDPFAAPSSATDERVVRGGSYLYDQDDCRVENRSKNPPNGRYPDTGFRCALRVRHLW